ncbi:hypothetical protein [Candidatus Regiella insecticola]|uniref:hypothetical protein n=1 Tax=Candidatus Regiella insecticola TaxID=138073 RepID=UPI000315B15C|nr:hypothetical protein [Candidatus Regiella insecticola]
MFYFVVGNLFNIPNEFRVTARRQSIESPKCIPFAFEVAFGCQGDRPMSVDILCDSVNTRSQQRRGGFKGY